MNTLEITKKILNKYNIRANKRYGQNFLIDDDILNGIVNVANISKEDLVIEIGPGLGNLTKYLLESAGYVIAVEIDKKMIEILNDRFSKYKNFLLLNEDILKVNIDEIIKKIEKESGIKYKNIKVVANLPYYVTTPIIFKLLQDENKINEITIMVQKEVADRMVANVKSKDYGILTLMVKYLADADIKLEVKNTCFIPAPNVTSSVIKLIKEKKYTVSNEKMLFDLIHSSFAQRRKKMINSLVATRFMNLDKSFIENIFKECNIDFNTRAEELSIEKYIQIVNNINEKNK